jgi:hypothetical protein
MIPAATMNATLRIIRSVLASEHIDLEGKVDDRNDRFRTVVEWAKCVQADVFAKRDVLSFRQFGSQAFKPLTVPQ